MKILILEKMLKKSNTQFNLVHSSVQELGLIEKGNIYLKVRRGQEGRLHCKDNNEM